MQQTKIMVRCDIEGVTGVVSYQQAEPGKPEYVFGQRMFMSDLLALLEGLHEGGADEVVIYDEHYYGRNIDMDALPGFATAICGKPPYRPDWAGGLDASFAGVVLLGFHAKFGTERGLLPHSYELDIRDLRLNGVSVGEIGMEAAVAGDFDVPVLMVAGDSAGVSEARSLLPGTTGVVVKEAIGETGALCYSTAVTSARIREAAARVVASPPAVNPYCLSPDVCLEVELNDGPYLAAVRRLCGDSMVNESTLVLRGKSATAVWAAYWERKLHARAS